MAAGATTGSAPPSLQRLLSLDKSFDNLTERVQEAARIIRLSSESDTAKPLHSARHEFVLRWLVDKLKKDAAARKTPEAWSTLHRTLRDLPSTALALSKATAASNLLPCIVHTLSEIFPAHPAVSTSTDASEDATADKACKKRKRSTSEKTNPSPDEADRRAIFLAIAALLRLLVDHAQEQHSQIRSLLRLDNAAFAHLLTHWLTALLLFLPDLHQQLSSPQATVLSFALHLIQDLLSLQSISHHSDPAQSFDILFSRECILPAALLLSRLHTASSSALEHYSVIDGAIRVLDRLLAQHVFVPARTAFHATIEHLPHAPTKPPERNPATLGERLDPFRCEIITLSKISPHTMATAQKALPHLLDIALRCTPTSTPRQRIAEAPWIDALFSALCSALPKLADAESLHINSTAPQTPVDMLNVMLKRNLSLSKGLLIDLVHDWSMLQVSSPSTAQPDFQIVARVVAMDANIFTDIKAPRTRALFESLSLHGTQPFNSDSQHASCVQGLLCHDIVVPLMKAFARIRSLRIFIDQWLLQLQKYPEWQDNQSCVWTDQSLQTSLRTVLESALTVPQITDLLESCRISLLDLVRSANSESVTPPSQASASTVILNAVVGALHSDSTIDAIQKTFQSLIETCQEILGLLKSDESFFTTSLLALLSRLYLLWFPALSTSHTQQAIQASVDMVLESSAMRVSLNAIGHFSKTTDSHLAVTDAAFAYIATICDLLRRFPNRNDNVRALVCKAALSQDENTEAVNSVQFAVSRPLAFYTTVAQYPCLLEYIPQADRQAVLQNLISFASQDSTVNHATSEMFVDAVLSATTQAVRDDLFSALKSQQGSEAERKAARSLLLRWSSRGLARQQREKMLDVAVDGMLLSGGDGQDSHAQLGIMVDLLELPNATAKIATDSSVIWQLASAIPAQGREDHSLDLFEEVCNLVLKHMMDTKEQERSKAFLVSLSKLLAAFMESKKTFQSCPGKLRLLTAFLRATEARLDAAALSEMPHRSSNAIDSLVKHLHQTLSTNLEEEDASDESRLDGIAGAVQVYAHMPTGFQANGGSTSSKYAKRLAKLLGSILARSAPSSSLRTDDLSFPLSMQVQCFELVAPTMIQEQADQLCSTAETLLLQDVDAKQNHAIFGCLADSARSMSDTKILSLIDQLLSTVKGSWQVTAQKVSLVRCLVMCLGKENKDEVPFLSVLTRLLDLLGNCTVFETHCEIVSCVVAILRNKPNMVTQYGIEATIATTIRLASPSSPSLDAKKGEVIFEGLCDITQSVFQFHRARLGGRYHVVITLVERLVSCLFSAASRDVGSGSRFKHPNWIDNKQHRLTARHARQVSRLVEKLCNPAQSEVSRGGRKNESGHGLVDVERKTRIQVGQHVHEVLHYVCTLMLNGGRLGEGMRDGLGAGLWAVMEVMEIGADESRGVKALSARMNNGERAILRGMFEDWRRFGSWSG